ncbi:unnamed protein product [Moneuplotes crassus]|uniref:Uncharacterized protein n=1 Tax=Euplotes crassus TaxID=5936 RepID=A0AAD1UCX9_EUPCR|nr:unnamed protein product [Moneuplotes crassus]
MISPAKNLWDDEQCIVSDEYNESIHKNCVYCWQSNSNVLVNDKGSARQLGKHSQRSCYQLLREGIIQVDSNLESDQSKQKSISSSLAVHAKDLKQEKSYKVFSHL